MIVVADTGPLNYLILIGAIDVLPAIHGTVLIPEAVYLELMRPKAPEAVRLWASSLPSWCEVRAIHSVPNAQLAALGAGERDAILLAFEVSVGTVVLDEWAGRSAAVAHGLIAVGTLATLEAASRKGLLSFRTALEKLLKTNFRISEKVREEFLSRNP